MRKPLELRLSPRWRVLAGGAVPIGPGKADLLDGIAQTGSLRRAAARMEMSYMRAWQLVRVMNDGFREPLVEFVRGGRGGGGARLTVCGRRALELYRAMEAASLRAVQTEWGQLSALLVAGTPLERKPR